MQKVFGIVRKIPATEDPRAPPRWFVFPVLRFDRDSLDLESEDAKPTMRILADRTEFSAIALSVAESALMCGAACFDDEDQKSWNMPPMLDGWAVG
jgi:hypothetical protein